MRGKSRSKHLKKKGRKKGEKRKSHARGLKEETIVTMEKIHG